MGATIIVPNGGNSGAATALKDATASVDVSAATAPTAGQVLTATDATHATWQAAAGGAPSGAAGGDLGGTYPNPTVAQARALKSATTTVDVSAATAPTANQVLVASSGTAATWAQVANAQVASAAAIAYSKLALTGAILNADLAGSIAYSKLSLAGAILNSDLAGSIAASKLTSGTAGQRLTTNGAGTIPVWIDGASSTEHSAAVTQHDVIPRWVCSQNPSWTSGDQYFAYFTARFDAVITKLGCIITTAGTTGSVTIGKLALWTANAAGDMLVVVATGSNDTSMGLAAAEYTQTISATLTAGQRYVIVGTLVHTLTTIPKVALGTAMGLGMVGGSSSGVQPRFSGKNTAATDTPGSALLTGAIGTNASPWYAFVR